MINDAGGAGDAEWTEAELTDQEWELAAGVFSDENVRVARLSPLAEAVFRRERAAERRAGIPPVRASEAVAWAHISVASFVLGFRMGQAEAGK